LLTFSRTKISIQTGIAVNDPALTDALKEIWMPNALPFMLGSLITFIGIASLTIWFLRKRTREIYFLYMGVFILLFGLRSLAGNELIRITGVFPQAFLV